MAHNCYPQQDDYLSDVLFIILNYGGGPMEFKDIRELLFPMDVRLKPLRKYSDILDVSDQNECQIVTPMELCADHCNISGCSNYFCDKFHLCKYFILSDSCKRKFNCHFGHFFKTAHNQKILNRFHLNHPGITLAHFVSLFRQNRSPTSMPFPCDYYYRPSGCRKGDRCQSLHICGYFVFGNCSYGTKCNRNHDIGSGNVIDILIRYGFDVDLPDNVVLDNLRQSYQQLNRLGSDVMRLTQFRQKDTEKPSYLTREGSFFIAEYERPPKENLVTPNYKKQLNINSKILQIPEICLANLKSKCRYNVRCYKVHSTHPYQWQVKMYSEDWTSVSETDNIDIEKAYCQCRVGFFYKPPGRTQSYWLNFEDCADDDFIQGRRLSTPDITQSTNSDDDQWMTRWFWYWRDNLGSWIKYGDQDTTGNVAKVTSVEIEDCCQDNKCGDFGFGSHGDKTHTGSNHSYVIDFTRMVQTNKQYQTERRVKRRPEFTDASVIQNRKQECDFKRKADIPSNWSILKADDIYSHYQAVQLPKSGQEYQNIQNDFLKGLSSTEANNISSLVIIRIENMELWKAFCAEKEVLSRKLKRTVDEERLYHGTQVENIDAITHQGFDCRLAGSRVGHLYGKGAYFGKTSGVSLRYCDASSNMFVVKALVGDYTIGSAEYPRPPLKNPQVPSSDLFDSCVDDLASPNMFVLFNNRQVYPEYLITIKYKNSRSQFPSVPASYSVPSKPVNSAPIKPASSQVSIKPASSQVSTKPASSQVFTKPASSPVSIKPVSSSAPTKLVSSSSSIKPVSSSAPTKLVSYSSSIKQVSSSAPTKPVSCHSPPLSNSHTLKPPKGITANTISSQPSSFSYTPKLTPRHQCARHTNDLNSLSNTTRTPSSSLSNQSRSQNSKCSLC